MTSKVYSDRMLAVFIYGKGRISVREGTASDVMFFAGGEAMTRRNNPDFEFHIYTWNEEESRWMQYYSA